MNDVYIHMDGSHIIVILEIERDKLIGVLDAVNEVAATLNHTLVDQLAERLSFTNITIVIEELVPETAVNQVSRGMFGTTHIEVYLTPVLIGLARYKLLVVEGIHVTQIIGRRTGKARHGVQLQRMTVGSNPVLGTAQGRLTSLGRQELVHFGELQG